MHRSQRIGAILGLSTAFGLASWSQAPQRDEAAREPWAAGVGKELRASEYDWTAVCGEEGVWSAPNRGQGLRVRVTHDGVEVSPRAGAAAWRLALGTRRFGRSGAEQELCTGELCVDGARAELSHRSIIGGSIVEWFENRSSGLDHGWTVASAPPGTGPLRIELALHSALALVIEEGARSAVLRDDSGETCLRYGDLRVSDASGRALRAWLESSCGDLAIRIDDTDALYPLTVDPALTCPAWTVESDQWDALLGWSIANAGDVNGDGFGDVIVGAPAFDNGNREEGRAFVYLGSTVGLSMTPAWTAESNQPVASFGISVATAGDVNGDGYSDVIVGAYRFDGDQLNEGRAFVYLGSAAGLSLSPAWTADGDQVAAFFGISVASAGDVNGDGYGDVLVGAEAFDDGESNEGRACVYLGSATGLAPTPAWTVEGGQDGAALGHCVAAAGDVNGDGYGDVLVGAFAFDDSSLFTDQGRAYCYLGSAAGLATSPAWTAMGEQPGVGFGFSLATAGDVNGDGFDDVIIGAPWLTNGQNAEGRAYVYLGSSAGLSSSAAWTAEANQAVASFGQSVAGAGDINGDGYGDIVVGAPGIDAPNTNQGRVYLYLGSATGPATNVSWREEGEQVDGEFGFSVAAAGDVNGDGYGDLAIATPFYGNGQRNEGRAHVCMGPALNPPAANVYRGDGYNVDSIAPVSVIIGSSWSAPLSTAHPHGTGGPLLLKICSTTFNGPTLVSPFGGRLTEALVSGTTFAKVTGFHDGTRGDIPPQPVPNQPSLVGLGWAAQYTVAGGGFADLSLAVYGFIDSCP